MSANRPSSNSLHPEDVAHILRSAESGDRSSLGRLFPFVYEELRRLAGAQLRRETPGHTLQPTALVHEAYLRVAQSSNASWKDRAHFVALAATVMRQVLVDHHRRRSASKRGGAAVRLALDAQRLVAREKPLDVLVLEEALRELAALDERKARVVELRVFGGLDVDETSHVLGVSSRTVEADWSFARAWLKRRIEGRSTAT